MVIGGRPGGPPVAADGLDRPPGADELAEPLVDPGAPLAGGVDQVAMETPWGPASLSAARSSASGLRDGAADVPVWSGRRAGGRTALPSTAAARRPHRP